MTELEEFFSLSKSLKETQSRIDNIGYTAFELCLTQLFKNYPTLDIIIIRGWTMSFNDGEPTYHTTNFFVSDNDVSEYTDDMSLSNKDLSDKEVTSIVESLELFEDVLRTKYDTNWKLVIKRSEESYTLTKDYYDCGY